MSTDSATFSLCVYCGSRAGVSPDYAELATDVGHWIGSHGARLVYGGGRNGLMGIVADATLAAGGEVIGVIPRALVDREHAHTGCTQLHVVDTMHERKRLMAEHSNAFVALPGGIGTLEELFETWTWHQLGYHRKPLGLLNHAGFYDGLVGFLQHTLDQGFLDKATMGLMHVGQEVPALLATLARHAPLNDDAGDLASS